MTNPTVKRYTELIKYSSFENRFNYLKLDGEVGVSTFGFERRLNQDFYHSKEWKQLRNQIIIRDNGCDLGLANHEILGKIYIHHLNPIRTQDIVRASEFLLNPEFLVCVSFDTHQALHYGNLEMLIQDPFVERKANDTCPWK